MTAYFITSTGTGLGKTFATCALVHATRGRGFKPVISGWVDGAATDTTQIIEAGGGVQKIEDVSPWRFAAPLSPHRAAVLENKAIDVERLIEWTRIQAQTPHHTFIETVGGIMVPLTDSATTLDWMTAVGLPMILVVGSYLGTISHTLTVLEVLRARGIVVKALILNESEGSSVALAEAEAGLAPFVRDIPLRISQPRVSSWREARAMQSLAERLS